MSPDRSFRTNVTFVVMAFAVLLGVLVIALGVDLTKPVPNMAPQVSWLMPETTGVRIAALKAVGRPETAGLYALCAALSWGLIGALGAAGFAWGVLNDGGTVLGLDKAIGYLTALAGLYAVSTLMELMLHSLGASYPSGGLHAIPALWFCSMIPSAAILARIAALIAHDAGLLITAAVEGEPKRLAALAASAEEHRGVKSIEARLARRLSARRPIV